MRKIYISFLAVVATMFYATSISAQYVAPLPVALDVPVSTGITIDGVGDEACYTAFQTMQICKEAGAASATRHAGDAVDFDAKFKLSWDKTYLYLYFEVVDDIEEDYVRGKEQSWTWDNSEVFIDLDTNSTTNTYTDTSTVQIRFCRGLKSLAGEDSLFESSNTGRDNAA
jgi:hypothetical protein